MANYKPMVEAAIMTRKGLLTKILESGGPLK
jgi:hypothetical protein